MSSAKDNRHNTLELSCIMCRKWHSKCDRKKPSCSYCIERNISCVYDRPPKKRGPRDAKTEMQEEMMLVKSELERYKQITVYWETKARFAEQQRRDILIQGFPGHPEARYLFRLNNSSVFYSLVDMYILEAFPSYGIKPPFTTLEEFNDAIDYSPQKGLMFSILANASASAGDLKLCEQLEYETKTTLGPLFDNSNHSDIPVTHFLMSETALTMGDREKWVFYFDIARRSTDNYVKKFYQKEEAFKLSKMAKYHEAILYAFQGNWAKGLKIINEFFDQYNLTIPKKGATIMQQTDKMFINFLKVQFEIGECLMQDSPISVQQYNTWIMLISESEDILREIRIPEKLRKNTSMLKNCVKTLLYHAGKQPHFVLENIREILVAARDPHCVGGNWTSKIVMIVAGLCLSYCWHDELHQALEILKSCSHRKIIAMAAEAIENIVALYGNGISFVDYIRMLTSFFDRSTNPQLSLETISVPHQPYLLDPQTIYANSSLSPVVSEGVLIDDLQSLSPDFVNDNYY